ncbi:MULTISPECIES: PQQ-dependent sugar dehydrogenase [unclassified Rathayibacter]|uniref:PQQ-dependent sugar dehydrogenase n=1 Tax=unclassified Rathayibacter TaxID=2609250 RepID=UPI0006FE7FC2|nr:MULTISPECIES: PQQ-dependent sugar dehydrogenase [unclassified Rathayibacter]KQQ00537.1 glucose dehydrogenase [Rathayibacter sp. Leaf294]KQS10736.1 glucose dehydrogenase [Rathayibacter sp. Leaf185]
MRFTLPRTLAVAVLAAALVFAGAPAHAAPAPTEASAAAPVGAPLVNAASKRCLDVPGSSTTNRTVVVIFDCNKGANQNWTSAASGEISVYGGTKCLEVRGRATTAGTAVQISDCVGGDWQKWRFESDGSIRGVVSGLCMNVKDQKTVNRTPVVISACSGGASQKWTTTASSADTTAPSAPANPRVTNLACRTATFSWNASTDAVGVSGYDVYHDGQFMKSVAGTVTSTGIDVAPGAQWGMYVNARDAAGNISQASSTVAVTVPQCSVDTEAPTTPAGLTARAAGTTVTVTWSASTDNVGVRSYTVLRGTTQVGTVAGSGTAAPPTTFTESGLTANTAYSYTVAAVDAQGNTSARSAAVAVTTGAACSTAICTVTQTATDTDIPWGLTTAPDGTVLYSRRDAHDLIRLNPTTGVKTVLGTVPNVQSTDGEGGLLGIAISPTFASDQWLYIMHTSPTDNRVIRLKLIGDRIDTSTVQVLASGILRNKYHNGGRLRFGPDGKLYVSTGDGQDTTSAQNLNSLSGKILRINPDGSIPADNPFGNAVWSYGHRNPQGLSFDSQGRLWEQEFGNSIMDETNLIVRGGNYGWPACEGTSGTCGTSGYIAPKLTFPTSAGSCSGLAVVRDVVYIACLRGARLYRAPIVGDTLATPTSHFVGTYGRLRTVEPDGRGGLWLSTSNTGDKDSTANNSNEKILRVTLGG